MVRLPPARRRHPVRARESIPGDALRGRADQSNRDLTAFLNLAPGVSRLASMALTATKVTRSRATSRPATMTFLTRGPFAHPRLHEARAPRAALRAAAPDQAAARFAAAPPAIRARARSTAAR